MSKPIRIRMYQAGFGDCFLLFLPTAAGVKTMLVDCGSLGGGTPPMKKVVPRMLADAAAVPGHAVGLTTHIDVIVATHRHRDHIGEFDQDIWRNVTTREVWMPWTERPDDPIAIRVRLAQENLARTLAATLPADASPGLRALAANALTNQKARDRLLQLGSATGARFRWIARNKTGANTFRPLALPGIEVFVLGPAKDPETFKELEPPEAQNFARRGAVAAASATGTETASAAGETTDGAGPFPARWRQPPGRKRDGLAAQDIDALRRAVPDAVFELLALNDRLINSTSVVVVLKVGGTHLLLPGDAQWSTWKAALGDPARRDLLAKTRFYKIGHHGSENATPIEFVETVLAGRTDCISMASWVKRANWERIPEEHLVAGLQVVGPFADHETLPGGSTFTEEPDGYYIEAKIPAS